MPAILRHDGDVLRWPVVGSFLRWRHARSSMQLVLLCIAGAVVVSRTRGPGSRPRQPLHRPHLGPLSRAAGRRAAGGRQPVLRRMSVRARARLGSAHPRAIADVAVASAWQMIAIVLFVAVLFCLRAVRPVGTATATAYLVLGYFVGGACRGSRVQGRDVLQAHLPDRSVQFRRVGHVAIGTTSPVARHMHLVPHVGLHYRPPRRGAAAGDRAARLRAWAVPAREVGNVDCTFCLSKKILIPLKYLD